MISFPQLHPPAYLPYVMVVLALCEIGLAIHFRRRFFRNATEGLRANPPEPRAIGQWRAGNMFSFCICVNIVLLGLVLRFLGFAWNIAVWFFVVGFVMLVLWPPRLELPPIRLKGPL
jgi:hypothetical protein